MNLFSGQHSTVWFIVCCRPICHYADADICLMTPAINPYNYYTVHITPGIPPWILCNPILWNLLHIGNKTDCCQILYDLRTPWSTRIPVFTNGSKQDNKAVGYLQLFVHVSQILSERRREMLRLRHLHLTAVQSYSGQVHVRQRRSLGRRTWTFDPTTVSIVSYHVGWYLTYGQQSQANVGN